MSVKEGKNDFDLPSSTTNSAAGRANPPRRLHWALDPAVASRPIVDTTLRKSLSQSFEVAIEDLINEQSNNRTPPSRLLVSRLRPTSSSVRSRSLSRRPNSAHHQGAHGNSSVRASSLPGRGFELFRSPSGAAKGTSTAMGQALGRSQDTAAQTRRLSGTTRLSTESTYSYGDVESSRTSFDVDANEVLELDLGLSAPRWSEHEIPYITRRDPTPPNTLENSSAAVALQQRLPEWARVPDEFLSSESQSHPTRKRYRRGRRGGVLRDQAAIRCALQNLLNRPLPRGIGEMLDQLPADLDVTAVRYRPRPIVRQDGETIEREFRTINLEKLKAKCGR